VIPSLFADAREAAAWLRSYSNGVLPKHDAVADVLDALAEENAEWDEIGNALLDALLLIQSNEHGESYSAGVAMSCIASIAEKHKAHERREQRGRVPRFLPTWLGGEADRVSGPGVHLRRGE
jgi:hypothetical protein